LIFRRAGRHSSAEWFFYRTPLFNKPLSVQSKSLLARSGRLNFIADGAALRILRCRGPWQRWRRRAIPCRITSGTSVNAHVAHVADCR